MRLDAQKHIIIKIWLIAITAISCNSENENSREYYEDGSLKQETKELLQGKKLQVFYYQDADTSKLLKYENNLLIRKKVYFNNYPVVVVDYLAAGDSIEICYHENGKLSSISQFKDGKKTSIQKSYYETGQLKTITNYKNGKPFGSIIQTE